MSGLPAAANHVQLGPQTLRSICSIGALKVQQLKKRLHGTNLAACGQIACGFVENAEW